jgi:hypothetical protein
VSDRRRMRVSQFWMRAGLWIGVLVGVGAVGYWALRWVPMAFAAAAAQDAGAVPGAAKKPPREKVKITFQTIPPVKAEVRWGKKKLGIIQGPKKPFILERPRDSGPLDVTIRAEGFLTVHTRAYTFTDGKMNVKLTPMTDKHMLFGFRQPLDGGVPDGGAPDGGVVAGPPPPPGAPYPPAPQPQQQPMGPQPPPAGAPR